MPSRAVFLDRDGTLIEDVGYLDRLDDVVSFPGRPMPSVSSSAPASPSSSSPTSRAWRAGSTPSRRCTTSTRTCRAAGRGGAVVDAWYTVRITPTPRSRPTGRLRAASRKPGMLNRGRGRAGPRPGPLGGGRRSVERRAAARGGAPACWSAPAYGGHEERTPVRAGADAIVPTTSPRPPLDPPGASMSRPRARHRRSPLVCTRHRSLRPLSRRRHRRLRRRRVRLRPGGAHLARGAGADPRIRLDRSPAGGAGNAANNVAALGGARPLPSALSATTTTGAALRARCTPASMPRPLIARPRPPDPDQDAHPRRRHPFRQAAGRAHGSRRAPARRPPRTARRFEQEAMARDRVDRRACWFPTTAPAW